MPYYIRLKGKAFGPFDEVQLVDMKTKGKVSRSTELSVNKKDWQTAETFEFLYQQQQTYSPQQQQPANTGTQTSATQSSGTGTAGTDAGVGEPKDWFYSVDGNNGYGPVTQSAIVQMIQNGTLHAEGYVWKEGQTARFIQSEPAFGGSIPTDNSTQPKSSFLPIMIIVSIIALFFIVLINVVVWLLVFNKPGENLTTDKGKKGDVIGSQEMSRNEIIEKAKLVTVTIKIAVKQTRGSGFIVARDDNFALIVTNWHVINDLLLDETLGGVCEVVSDKSGNFSGEVVALPKDKKTDMALILVRDPDEKLKPTLKIGDYNSLVVGSEVYACGSPLGLDFSFSKGIVSAIRENQLIQTDAAINAGNSGGPLITTTGHIIGVNTISLGKALGTVEGLNFAIRADFVLQPRNWTYDSDYEKDVKTLIKSIK
ncbi:MAG: trypsin-like peptidase domain-containing protein [Planctomycetaceae bacterium]|jgi:S1-C subfamily serine protease|nr:trypsin-like peptidase domain-containing protein [Planctomycetaceae bacterium]